jgi:glutamate racemase
LRAIVEFGADTVVLGCTHYPLLLPVLRIAAHELGAANLCFVDPADALAGEVQHLAAHIEYSKDAAKEPDMFFVSGEEEGVRHWVQNVLDIRAPQIEHGPVFDLEPHMNVAPNS